MYVPASPACKHMKEETKLVITSAMLLRQRGTQEKVLLQETILNGLFCFLTSQKDIQPHYEVWLSKRHKYLLKKHMFLVFVLKHLVVSTAIDKMLRDQSAIPSQL